MKSIFFTAIILAFSIITINAQVVNTNNNVGVGQGVLSSNTTGYRSIALGNYALNQNKTGISNNALGYKALYSHINGGFNVAIGSFSLYSTNGATNDIAIGHKALYSNINGCGNIALGYQTLYSNDSGHENTALGYKSMHQRKHGSHNTAVGSHALQGINSSGNKNTALGTYSLYTISTGSENIAIGYKTGENLTTGIRNNAIGAYSYFSNSSSYNTIIGYRTASYGNNNIIIGKKIALPQGVSNAMNIGGVLFGIGFQSGLPESPLETPVNGKIGINVVNPMATLDVAGTANISSNFYVGGNIGIGTKNPDQKLTVKGKIHAEEILVDTQIPFPDYVFNSDYQLMPLKEVEQFVKNNHHLPQIPTAGEVLDKGLNLGEMQTKLLQKIEELTLYVIQQQKEIEELKNKIQNN